MTFWGGTQRLGLFRFIDGPSRQASTHAIPDLRGATTHRSDHALVMHDYLTVGGRKIIPVARGTASGQKRTAPTSLTWTQGHLHYLGSYGVKTQALSPQRDWCERFSSGA